MDASELNAGNQKKSRFNNKMIYQSIFLLKTKINIEEASF